MLLGSGFTVDYRVFCRRSKTGIAQLQPPVRSTGKCDSKAPAPVATPASKGSKVRWRMA
jgi:hypothetical protein